MTPRWMGIGSLLTMHVTACGGTSECVPGRSLECACPGGLAGVQVCTADGTFATCSCESGPRDAGRDSAVVFDAALDAGGSDGGFDAAADAGVDAGLECGDPHAPGSWEMLGDWLGVLPGDTGSSQPSLAVDSSDAPVIAWSETGLPMMGADLYVLRWDGTEWDLLGSVLNVVPGVSSERASLVVDSMNRPVVAFAENRDVHVWRFEDGLWEALGVARGTMAADDVMPSLALDAAGEPVLGFMSADGTTIESLVETWDGTAWRTRGTRFIPSAPWDEVGYPRVAISDSEQVVALWEYDRDARMNRARVFRWDVDEWMELASDFRETNDADVALDGSNRPVLAWASTDLRIDRWTGTEWESLGSASAGLPAVVYANEADLEIDRLDRPVVAFRVDGLLGGIYVRRLNGRAWETLDGPLGMPMEFSGPYDPTLTLTRCGDPIVAWVESMTGRGGIQAIRAARYVRR